MIGAHGRIYRRTGLGVSGGWSMYFAVVEASYSGSVPFRQYAYMVEGSCFDAAVVRLREWLPSLPHMSGASIEWREYAMPGRPRAVTYVITHQGPFDQVHGRMDDIQGVVVSEAGVQQGSRQ